MDGADGDISEKNADLNETVSDESYSRSAEKRTSGLEDTESRSDHLGTLEVPKPSLLEVPKPSPLEVRISGPLKSNTNINKTAEVNHDLARAH